MNKRTYSIERKPAYYNGIKILTEKQRNVHSVLVINESLNRLNKTKNRVFDDIGREWVMGPFRPMLKKNYDKELNGGR